MRAKIIADLAVTVTLIYGFGWWLDNVPFVEEVISWQQGLAGTLSIDIMIGAVVAIDYYLVRWIHKRK